MKEKITTQKLQTLAERYGNSFYLLDSAQFRSNYRELKSAFEAVYPHFNIAYSYKTNYTPKLCKIVDEMGGYAEVVSEMEMEIALCCGVMAEKIIWNGPVKSAECIEELLLAGGCVNIDSLAEAERIQTIADRHPDKIFQVGVRCNFDVGDEILSRFGFDTDGEDFGKVCEILAGTLNLHLKSLQCHFAKRKVEYWPGRAAGILAVYEKVREKYGIIPDRIDLGGGIYGKMPESLSRELGYEPPGYEGYAKAGASELADRFYGGQREKREQIPELLIEPGSALVGDCMQFVTRIDNIRNIRGKWIATATGSQKNISMTGLNPPLEVFDGGGERKQYADMDIAGYTCIEADYLYRHYTGWLGTGDFLVINNCGSYSVVMKPPFIQPNVPVLDIGYGMDKVEVVKRKEGFEDLFRTFYFA
ncbi:pyridoxal-dependent decarboxylase [Acetatifactor muris]|uniref:Diaminopimelate decarboxylase n=1 Tax=Acetatifactor muris TaxID=879566 RepID=A0A2K4ZEL8_9FIRM|nr:pyridoxal-dependent decarboxylase [Acetatifactor muris]MCR2048506.1 pyridoxal-dependent decarboxylase [Acetatifactor muris]SOY28898.1 Diaminopimelate decarboxylase [Acetatifactor muris]